MPIKGLTDKRRLPRLGKIHLGMRARTDKNVEYPVAVDYFVCPEEVTKVFGDKPRELPILIPVEDEERWASQYYRAYSRTRGLLCKGDGERATRLIDVETGAMADKDSLEVKMQEISCEGRGCPEYQAKSCREMMNLQFLLPDVPGYGIWQIDTSSVNSIVNINSGAELIRLLHGRVSMIPLLLTVEPQEVIAQDRTRKKVHVLNLRTRETLRSLMQNVPALPAPEAGVELPNPEDEVPDLILSQEQAPQGEAVAPEEEAKRKPVRTPRNLILRNSADLFNAAKRYLNMTQEAVLKDLGVSSVRDIGDVMEAWNTLVLLYTPPPEGA